MPRHAGRFRSSRAICPKERIGSWQYDSGSMRFIATSDGFSRAKHAGQPRLELLSLADIESHRRPLWSDGLAEVARQVDQHSTGRVLTGFQDGAAVLSSDS
jgi:hypothetical protein